MRRFARAALVLASLAVLSLVTVKLCFGGGAPFPVETAPPERTAEIAATLPLPPGCVTVSPDGRVFFDTHPFAAPGRLGAPHLFEWSGGQARPWPSAEAQSIFVAPFGLTADGQGRLWVTEPATLDRAATRLLAFDRATGALVHKIVLPAGEGRFAQDLRVSPDGSKLVLADTGAFSFTPGQLLVVDIATRRIERRLRHQAFNPQGWFIRRFDGAPHRVTGGLLSFQVGLDGLAFSQDGGWLYLASMSHDTLYRLPTGPLLDGRTPDDRVLSGLETVGPKPQSDGIATTADGAVLVTDVTAAETLPAQMRARGLDPAAVKGLVLTHQHLDHTGSTRAFLGADVWTAKAENDAAQALGAMPWRWRDDSTRIRHVDLEGKTSELPFRGVSLTQDGRIEVLWTPGHTPGSTSVRLRADEGEVWFVGDATFRVDELGPDASTTGMHSDVPTTRSLQAFLQARGALTTLLPAHDEGVRARLKALA